MATAAQKKAALEAVAEPIEDAATVTFVDALPDKPKQTRTTWWDGIRPQLDANPGAWALVYEGVGDNPDRNALSRIVRTRKMLKDADLLGSVYEIEKRGASVYARHV